MANHRGLLQRRPIRRLVDHPAVRTGYTLYETAWAAAWPHLDDWFTAEALLRQRGEHRPIII